MKSKGGIFMVKGEQTTTVGSREVKVAGRRGKQRAKMEKI